MPPFGPFGRRGENPADQPDAAAQARDAAALAAGGLPARALERLAGGAGAPWSSTLSSREALLGRALMLRPLGMVMGSAIMTVGFAAAGLYGVWREGDLEALSQALSESRRRALQRLQAEAQALGADGVVGIRLRADRPQWGNGVREFVAIGTAVRWDSAAGAHPDWFMGTLSLQETDKLIRAGYLPLTLVYATTAYYVMTSYTAAAVMASWQNQEVEEYSEAVYRARNLVVARMAEQAREAGAEGVLGSTWEMAIEEVEVERPALGSAVWGSMGAVASWRDHILYLTVTGSAVMPRPGTRPGNPAVVLAVDP